MRIERNELSEGEVVGRRRRDDPTDGETTLRLRAVVDGATTLPSRSAARQSSRVVDDRLAARRAYLKLIARRLRKDPMLHAFTVIELMVVIAVIAMLAALLIGILPRVMEKRVTARVEADLALLTTAIEYYKEKQGFYPPDNTDPSKTAAIRAAQPPLFYELVGTTNSGGDFYPLNGDPKLSGGQIQAAFGTGGFLNSGEAGEVKSFHKTIRENQYNWSPFPDAVRVLTVPANGPKYPGNPGTETTNTWRYVVGNPELQSVHNPNTYDLWAEVVYRGRTNVIGNWRR